MKNVPAASYNRYLAILAGVVGVAMRTILSAGAENVMVIAAKARLGHRERLRRMKRL